MSDVLTGNLEVGKTKSGWKPYLEVPVAKDKTQRLNVQKGWLSTELAALLDEAPEQLRNKAVEYRLIDGKPQQVWEPGKVWDRAPTGSRTNPKTSSAERPETSRQAANYFENPYNFVPAPPRDTSHPDLGDAPPVGHHRWHANHWSGRIKVELTTATPLLIPDLGRPLDAENDGHKVYGARVDESGLPYLPPTSIKGALRAAYEAITNSRMGVFAAHQDPLALRHAAQSGADVVPAIVGQDDKLHLMPGFSEIGNDGKPGGNLMYAAWVPCYGPAAGLLQLGQQHVQHGRCVWAKLERWLHYISKKGSTDWICNFSFFRAIAIAPDSQLPPELVTRPTRVRPRPQTISERYQRFSEPLAAEAIWVKGWLCVTNRNMGNKHDERLFFVNVERHESDELACAAQSLADKWRALIRNYQEEHRKEIEGNVQRPPALPDFCTFSRHIRGGPQEQRFASGTLCYARVRRTSGQIRVEGVFPVQISRDLYRNAPDNILGESLLPAWSRSELSPADRVFGWVNGKGNGSHKGQLRIGKVTCLDGADAVERIPGPDGKPLAILGQPKPAQARFYAARDQQGEPMGKVPKMSGYAPNTGLRGRKVYAHQAQAEKADYWDATTSYAAQTASGLNGQPIHREWQHHDDTRDSQNRSITAWVKTGTRFCLDIDVINLSAVELGALLWLLSLPDGHYLRIGGGKPLGFGSVQLTLTGLDLRDGAAVRSDYGAFDKPALEGERITSVNAADKFIDAYRSALPAALGKAKLAFDDIPVIKAFCNGTRGGKLPVHYPRTAGQPSPAGETYQWFVANENSNAPISLPALWRDDDDRGLPAF